MSHSKSNNVGEIDIPFYLNSGSRLICTTSQKRPDSISYNYSYLFISVSDSYSGILLELMQMTMDIIRESYVVLAAPLSRAVTEILV